MGLDKLSPIALEFPARTRAEHEAMHLANEQRSVGSQTGDSITEHRQSAGVEVLLHVGLPDLQWQQRTACKGQNKLFCGPSYSESENQYLERKSLAAAICQSCTVLEACGTYAIENVRPDDIGFWAGMDAREIHNARRNRARASGIGTHVKPTRHYIDRAIRKSRR